MIIRWFLSSLSAVAAAVFVLGVAVPQAHAVATTIDILCSQSEVGCTDFSGMATDGTTFVANPNPTLPATGTGVFEPFKRVQRVGPGEGLQNGFNTDAGEPGINFDTKASIWTRSVQFGELGTTSIGGIEFYELQLDANENGSPTSLANQIIILDMQIYIGGDPNLANPEATSTGFNGTGYTGTPYNSADNGLLGLAPVWTLDNAINGDVDVLLQASICDNPGQCGSGHGDLSVFIPMSLLAGSATDFFVLYTEYDEAGHGSGGFEEWRFGAGVAVPEPAALGLFGLGLLGLAAIRRRRKIV